MLKKNYIEFKKKREFGEILGDTFAFLRTQFKPFFSTLLKIAGPYIFAFLVAYAFYMYAFNGVLNFNVERSNDMYNPILMVVAMLFFFVTLIFSYAMAQSVTLHYIKNYIENNGETNYSQVKSEVYSNFWKFIGLTLLAGICLVIGTMICVIPGIYLFVPLSLSFSILIFNKKNVTDAFSESFSLIKDYWWITFAYLLVVFIIVMVAGWAFSIPSVIYTYAKMGIFSGEMDPENMMNSLTDPIALLLNAISTLFQYLLNIISVVASVMIYFDLNEKKNLTGTMERIQNLGNTSKL